MNIVAKPLEYFRAPKSSVNKVSVDRTGGDYGAGVIRGASLITAGEARGHDMWIDSDFVGSVEQAVMASANGIKVRFTHPSLSGDGLGTFMGRAKRSSIKPMSGSQALADIHFAESAHETPDGDLAEYVMNLAEEDPAAFAMSIVFKRDRGEEDRHRASNTDAEGNYRSPDKNNKGNFRHVRLAELKAADFVDEPAANPNGLFHRGHEIADEADRLCSYALGLSSEKPTLTVLSADVDRLASFAARFLDSHGLEVKEKAIMAEMTLADVQKAIEANNTNLLSSIDAKLSASVEAAIAKLAKKDDPKVKSEPTADEALSLVKEFTALAQLSGLPDSDKLLAEWTDKIKLGFTVTDAKAQLGDLAIKHNKFTEGDPNPEGGNLERKLAAAYDEHASVHKALGISKEDFIKGAKAEMLKAAKED